MKKNENDNIFHLNVGVGIIGSKEVSVSKNNDETEVKIRLTGTARNPVIPCMTVFCEDELTKTIMESIAAEEKIPLKIHLTGSWKNLPRLNFGLSLLMNLDSSHQKHVFLCVVDGDIEYSEIERSINNAFDGNHKPDYLPRVISDMKDSIVSFKIPAIDIASFGIPTLESISGTPEYYHKTLVETVNKDLLLSIEPHKSEIEKYQKILCLENLNEDVRIGCEINLSHEESYIKEVLRIIDISCSIVPNLSKSGKTLNYHNYYEALSEKLKVGNSFMHYPVYNTYYAIIKIISSYRHKEWVEYTSPVRDKLKEKWELHKKIAIIKPY